MKTAADIELGDEWVDSYMEDQFTASFWYGEIVHIHTFDPLRKEVILYTDETETEISERYFVDGHQHLVTLYIRQASGHVITRTFWSTDVVEDNYNGKVEKLST